MEALVEREEGREEESREEGSNPFCQYSNHNNNRKCGVYM